MTAYQAHYYDALKRTYTLTDLIRDHKHDASIGRIQEAFRLAAVEYHETQINKVDIFMGLSLIVAGAGLFLSGTSFGPRMLFDAGLAGVIFFAGCRIIQKEDLAKARESSAAEYAGYVTETERPGNKDIYRIAERILKQSGPSGTR